MSKVIISEYANFIWAVADDLRGDYKQSDYGKVIIPLTVLRRLDAVLADTKDKVISLYIKVKDKKLDDPDILLDKSVISQKISKYTSKFVIKSLVESDKALEIVENIERYEEDIAKLKSKIKKEKQINRQTEIHIRINKLNKDILNLINQL